LTFWTIFGIKFKNYLVGGGGSRKKVSIGEPLVGTQNMPKKPYVEKYVIKRNLNYYNEYETESY